MISISTRYFVNGRWLTSGMEVTLQGVRGRHVFVRSVSCWCDEHDCVHHWLDFTGPRGTRSFRPDRIKTVHQASKERRS